MFVRGGRSLGSTTFFPKAPFAEPPEVLAHSSLSTISEREAPAGNHRGARFRGTQVLESTLSERSGHKVRIASSVRGIRARWLEMMRGNAAQALQDARPGARQHRGRACEDMREAFDLEESPPRIECFDISHTGGTDTVASCVVFGVEGRAEERLSALQHRRHPARATTTPRCTRR